MKSVSWGQPNPPRSSGRWVLVNHDLNQDPGFQFLPQVRDSKASSQSPGNVGQRQKEASGSEYARLYSGNLVSILANAQQ